MFSSVEKKYLDNLTNSFENLSKSLGRNTKGYGSINPPKGLFEPDEKFFRWNVDGRGVRDRFYNITFDILREISRKVAPIASIHTLRSMQVRPFASISYNEDDIGYMVKIKDKKRSPTKQERKTCEEIEQFLLYAGYVDFPEADKREEGIEEINEQLYRELLTIDQTSASLRRNRKGKIIDYWLLDASTIKRTLPGKGYMGDKEITFVQEVEGKIVETFTNDDLIFYYANRRADIRRKGYGYSFIEMAVDVISSWLFGMTYNKEFFNTSSQPKGIITFEGEKLDQVQLEELQRQWVSMFAGIKGLWKTPFLQYAAKWQPIAPSNRDMEFNEYIQVLSGWIFAIHGTDAQEVGIRLNQAQNVLNENADKKIAYSKDRGLKHLLTSMSVFYNRILQKVDEWRDYYVTFTGLESKNQKELVDIESMQVKTYMTVNQKRAEKDLPKDPYGDIILDPVYIQYRMQTEQMKMQQTQNQQPQGQEESNNEGDDDFSLDEKDLIPEETKKSLEDEYVEIIL
jgi:hypothetical protein